MNDLEQMSSEVNAKIQEKTIIPDKVMHSK